MKARLLKAVRTIEEFDENLFSDLGIGVEIQDFTEPALSHYEMYKTISLYQKKLQGFSMPIALHGSFLDIDIASFNRDIAQYSERLYLRDLFFAKLLNASHIIFHANVKVSANKNAHDYFLKLQREFFPKAIEATGFAGVIALENVLEKSPLPLLELVEAINHKQVRLNLDVGHAKISETSISDWISLSKQSLGFIHLHSNNGVEDTHSPVTIQDAELVVSALKENLCEVPISLEYWNCDLKHEVEKMRMILC